MKRKPPPIIFDAPEPTKTYSDPLPTPRVVVEDKPKTNKKGKKGQKKKYNKLSLLLNDEQYQKVFAMAESEDRSMTKLVIRHLIETGFIQ